MGATTIPIQPPHVPAGQDPALRVRSTAPLSRDGTAMDATTIPIHPVGGKSQAFEYLTTKKDELIGWARKFSLFPYPFVTACCAMEFMSVSSTPYDTDRFGAALPRFSPRQADLLMVVGTISHKQAPILKKVYDQMCEPKWVMAFGVCATSGGFYQNYAAVAGIDRIIPVDIYVPGCPPRPEMVIDGIMRLQDMIAKARHPIVTKEF
jgi:NADH-quinone oxidoreductase subunit B